MGYETHITRKENWFDKDGPVITVAEWEQLVAEDAEMRMDGFAEAISPSGEIIRIENEGIAVWTGHASGGESDDVAWFSFRRGKITVKNADVEVLIKMGEIARRLSAKVQGDEGELYDECGQAL